MPNKRRRFDRDPDVTPRKVREGPNYKPLDEVRSFAKALCCALERHSSGVCKKALPQYFKQVLVPRIGHGADAGQGERFAVANGAHRATVERDLATCLTPIVLSAFTKADDVDVSNKVLSMWHAHDQSSGRSSCFDAKHSGFGLELARNVLTLAGCPHETIEIACEQHRRARPTRGREDALSLGDVQIGSQSSVHEQMVAGL